MRVAPDPELQEQVLRLTQEKRELQDYAERVTRELRRYQQARPAPPARPEDDLPLPPWATNMQMMSPLLFAYEERISELEAVIERSVNLAEQAQYLTKENDTLRVELQERTEQLRNTQLMAPLRDGGRDGAFGEQADEIQELYRLSVEQNEALAQQNQLLKLQVERMQQTLSGTQQQARELQARLQHGTQVHAQEQDRAVKAYIEEKDSSGKALAEEQQRSEAYARQRGAVEQRLEEITGELVEEVRAREHLQNEVDTLQQELHVQVQSLDFYKKSFEDRCTMAADEEERLQTDLDRTTQSERSLRHRLAGVDRELAEVTEQLFGSRREADATKQEAEQMLRLMESIERRLRDISAQHEQAKRDLTEKDSQLSDLQVQKDGWTTSEQAFKRQVERLETRLKSETGAIRHHRENEGESLQHSHRRALSDLEEQLRKSEQATTELQSKVELSNRQKAWEAAALERQSSVYTMEKERLQGDLDELQQERLRLERQAELSRKEGIRLREKLEAAAVQAREGAARAGTEVAAAQAKFQTEERSLRLAKEELKTCETRVSGVLSEQGRLQTELREEKSRAGDLAEAERHRAKAERRALERQLQSVQNRARQDEQRAVELLSAQEALRQRLQAELTLEKEGLEAQIERLHRENRSLKEKSRSVLRIMAQRRIAGAAEA